MKRVLLLARRGIGKVHPNPAVGCVLVRRGKIISEGFHERYGGPHAEINALVKADPALLPECTLYVNLEPCSHYGKTPPCTEAIIRSGIRNVVVGCTDPNPVVNGRGIRKLRNSGISVTEGVLEPECRSLNESFFHFMKHGRPFVTLKAAQTLDGCVATTGGESRWISGSGSRAWVHRLRAEQDAILVGICTVLRDDPELTVRDRAGKRRPGFAPIRIVLDPRLRIPLTSRLVRAADPERTVVIAGPGAQAEKRLRLINAGVQVWTLKTGPDGRFRFGSILNRCAGKGILSILVEGGPDTWTSALSAGFADRWIGFISPRLMGEGIPVLGDLGITGLKKLIRFERCAWRRSGEDILFIGERPCSPVLSKK
ncbi:bifunctional diaminohydroxyphosphoribosylaminopyrimidine deaminase/5-amino-6-(5-phosphoribosylamino)uracil reductase RibD [bacterium]|nr:bifunctional diaminohydroxyphosphoribosylaminopyrimidine deaminase/5-amino-6-(5-phosphoribosylamino)uracil reductase RibD [bacterium]